MNLVIDASSFAPILIPDEQSDLLPGLEQALADGSVLVPRHWRTEVANMLLVAKRRGRLSDIDQQLAARTLEHVMVNEDLSAAMLPGEKVWRLAEQHKLTFYDALYLELALRRQASLATADKALQRAARSSSIDLFGQ